MSHCINTSLCYLDLSGRTRVLTMFGESIVFYSEYFETLWTLDEFDGFLLTECCVYFLRINLDRLITITDQWPRFEIRTKNQNDFFPGQTK